MNVRTRTLPNGFRIVTENMPGLKSASLGIWVTAGCRHERADQNGIAHFLEHMAFKGTTRRTALQIAEEIEDVGGYINAYTSREMTAYYVRVLENDVPLALDVISDIVLNPLFDAREIETERGVILQEIGQTLDTPDDIIFDWLQETAFPDQPMGRPILGSAERVRAFHKADFQEFVNANYRPGNMILSAAGAVDHDAIVAAAEAIFGGLATHEMPSAPAAKIAGGEHRVERDLEQAHFALALPSPSFADDDLYVGQVHSSIMGGGMSSRLFQEIREKRGLCYTIFAQASAFADSGMFTIYAGTSGDTIAELAEVAIDELRRASDNISTQEVTRAAVQMKAGLLMGLESPASRCERLARMIAIWNRVPDLEEVVAKIDAIDVEQTRAYAHKLCNGAPALALYGPVAKAPDAAHLGARLNG
jgi:predicted Zn-dependent peptidase